jgi:Putative peptidoglycan binding domain
MTSFSQSFGRACSCSSQCSCAWPGRCRCTRQCSCRAADSPQSPTRRTRPDPAAMWDDVREESEMIQRQSEIGRGFRSAGARSFRSARPSYGLATRAGFRSGYGARPWSNPRAMPAFNPRLRAVLLRRMIARRQARILALRARWNIYFARRLGWNRMLPWIGPIIGCPGCPPNHPAFVAALIRWQRANGLPPTGVLSPKVWRRLLRRLQTPPSGFGPQGAPQPNSDTAPDPSALDTVDAPFPDTPTMSEPPIMGADPSEPPGTDALPPNEPPTDDPAALPAEDAGELDLGFRRRRAAWNARERERAPFSPALDRTPGQVRLGPPAPRHVTRLTPWPVGFRP